MNHGHGHGHGHGHSHHFPLHAGHSFEVLFLVESHKYKIAINGHHFTEYHFRTPAERVCYLSIDGDVMISSVHFEGGSHGFPGTMPPGHLPPLGPVPVPVPIPVPVPTPLPVPMGYPSVYPPGSKKALKQQRKAQKKALKYGLPIAGMAGGAYLLHKGIKHAHHGFHHGSSSSSSSSSSEEE